MGSLRTESPALLNGHDAARSFFSSAFAGASDNREQLLVAHVDQAARCLQLEAYDGEPESVGMPIRKIVADATRLGSSAVVLAHNHPSGDSRPSSADCRVTRKLVQAGEAIDLAILDHLIFSGQECSSMRRLGLL
jgi:DNA repair protein RadC